MTTDFSSLPVVDLAPLSRTPLAPKDLRNLGGQLDNAFTTTGFAYLINAPLSFSHGEIFGLAREVFDLPREEKMGLAKRTFRPDSLNTYRGYFPPQPGQPDNLKEGFEIGPDSRAGDTMLTSNGYQFNLNEPNVWPPESVYSASSRAKLEKLYTELQELSSRLLSLLATALGKPDDYFAGWMNDSVSTFRLLHYPPQPGAGSAVTEGRAGHNGVRLCCTPHTDSGILTLLHQDTTGGLEVRNSSGEWIPAPYVPGSIVVNIGDLMARVSGGRYVATLHRVRASGLGAAGVDQSNLGRISVPFFFEPGENCLVKSVSGDDEGVRYGEHVRAKMSTWVEFQDARA